jgi:hypothetical protein
MAAAFLLKILKHNAKLNPVFQTCYDLKLFYLKTVTDCISIKAVQRKNQQTHQLAVMVTTMQKTQFSQQNLQ